VRKYRHAYAQLRSGFHELEIEKGRYNNTPIADRLCKICYLDQVENELHIILICPLFDDLRRRYIAIDSITTPTVDNFYALMSNRNELVVKHLASYINILCIATKTRFPNALTFYHCLLLYVMLCHLLVVCLRLVPILVICYILSLCFVPHTLNV